MDGETSPKSPIPFDVAGHLCGMDIIGEKFVTFNWRGREF